MIGLLFLLFTSILIFAAATEEYVNWPKLRSSMSHHIG